MPSNEQRRQAARRKLRRQMERRAVAARRRRRVMAAASAVAVVVVFGVVYLVTAVGHDDKVSGSANAAGTSTSAAPVQTSNGPCKYTTTPSQPAPTGRDVGLPADPSPTPDTGTVDVTLHTNQGDIGLTLQRSAAPCTVQSFVHLVQTRFFDNTPCHRLTADEDPPLKVLQCGDPTGTGGGGPGYTIPDEKPTNLKLAPSTTPVPQGEEQPVVYPAGTVAMANTGQPDSGGSQFFLVYADSQLTPDYTVFGTVDPAGMQVLARIAAGGINPTNGPNDGAPKLTVTIQQAVVKD